MHDLAIARPGLRGVHPFVLGELRIDVEVLVATVPVAGTSNGSGMRKTGRAREPPAVGELARPAASRPDRLRARRLHPSAEQVLLVVASSARR